MLELSILGTLRNHNANANENVACIALISSRYSWYFVIIPIRSTCTMWPNYPVTEQVETAFKLRQRLRNLPSCVHVLHKALTLVISRCGLAEHKLNNHSSSLCTATRNPRKTFCSVPRRLQLAKYIVRHAILVKMLTKIKNKK